MSYQIQSWLPQMLIHKFKNRLDRHWREEDFLYNHKAPIPGHHLAEDRAKRFEHVDLTIEANAGLRSWRILSKPK